MMLTRKLMRYNNNIRKCLSTVPLQITENSALTDRDHGMDTKENVLLHPDYFNVNDLFTIKDLFDARVHFGHKITSLHGNMKPYLFGSRLNHLIFDLNITAHHLRKALNFAAHIAYQNGIILFVSKNSSVTLLVERTALECKEYAVTRQWKIGSLMNAKSTFGCVVRLPDLCIVLNTLEENGYQHPIILEAAKMLIPTIGIVDTNSNPNLITYPVPGNDDSYTSIKLYCDLFKKAILRGKNKKQEQLKNDRKEEQK